MYGRLGLRVGAEGGVGAQRGGDAGAARAAGAADAVHVVVKVRPPCGEVEVDHVRLSQRERES